MPQTPVFTQSGCNMTALHWRVLRPVVPQRLHEKQHPRAGSTQMPKPHNQSFQLSGSEGSPGGADARGLRLYNFTVMTFSIKCVCGYSTPKGQDWARLPQTTDPMACRASTAQGHGPAGVDTTQLWSFSWCHSL